MPHNTRRHLLRASAVAALLAGLGRDGVRRQPDLTLAAP